MTDKMNVFKAAALAAFLLAGPARLYAGAPLKINFQGRLDESGQPAEGTKTFVFKLYDAAAGGSLVWTSEAQPIALANGVFSALLSTGAPADISTATFAAARYVEMTVDGVPLSPRQEMVAAPYALVAQALAADAQLPPAVLADGSVTDAKVSLTTAAVSSGRFTDLRVLITTGAFAALNGPDQLVKLDSSSRLPAVDGSQLTGLPVPSGAVARAGDTMTGQLTLAGSTLTVTGASFSVGVSTLVVKAGRVGIGVAAPSATLDVLADSYVSVRRNAADALPVSLALMRSRGTPAAPAALANGDYVGSLGFPGFDGSSYLSYANVNGIVDGAVSAGVMPTAIRFNTGSSGAGGTERMRITSAGSVGIGTAAPGYLLDVQGGYVNASGGLCIAGNCKSSWASAGDGLGGHTASQALDMAGYSVHNVSTLTVAGSAFSVGATALSVGGGKVGISTGSANSALTLGGAMSLPIRTVTGADSPYTPGDGDYTVLVDASLGAVTVLLPDVAAAAGRVYVVKALDLSNPVSLDTAGAPYEGTAGVYAFGNQYDSVILQSDGAAWYRLGGIGSLTPPGPM